MSLAHGRSTVVVRVQIAATAVNLLPATVGMAVISPYEDQGGARKCKLFAVGHPSLGIFATEGGHFIGGHGMSDDNKLRTATGLSTVWVAIRSVGFAREMGHMSCRGDDWLSPDGTAGCH
jgi:hypothetical protein